MASVLSKQLTPLGSHELPNAGAADRWVPHRIVVHIRRKWRPHHQWRVQEDALEGAEKTFPNHLVTPDDERFPGLEPEIFRRHIVAHDFDLAGIGYSESSLVRHSEERNRQRVEAHQTRGDRIDGDRIGRCEKQVFHSRNHRAWSGSVTSDGACLLYTSPSPR